MQDKESENYDLSDQEESTSSSESFKSSEKSYRSEDLSLLASASESSPESCDSEDERPELKFDRLYKETFHSRSNLRSENVNGISVLTKAAAAKENSNDRDSVSKDLLGFDASTDVVIGKWEVLGSEKPIDPASFQILTTGPEVVPAVQLDINDNEGQDEDFSSMLKEAEPVPLEIAQNVPELFTRKGRNNRNRGVQENKESGKENVKSETYVAPTHPAAKKSISPKVLVEVGDNSKVSVKSRSRKRKRSSTDFASNEPVSKKAAIEVQEDHVSGEPEPLPPFKIPADYILGSPGKLSFYQYRDQELIKLLTQ